MAYTGHEGRHGSNYGYRYTTNRESISETAERWDFTTNQTIINKAIEPSARSIHPRFILEDILREKEQRKIEAAK